VASLSIIIPSHNRPELLRACLRTVNQHAPPGTEILVVDDGSPERSISQAAEGFADVRVLRCARRRGFCAAINTGIQAAGGEIVELLNDDTEVTAGWAEAALRNFADPAIGAVAPLVLFWPGTGDPISKPGRSQHHLKAPIVDSAGDRYYVGGVAAKRGHRQWLSSSHLRPCRVFGASASSGFFRRDLLLRLGGLPESFGAYFEDVDLAFRLHWAGYQARFEPSSRVVHHVSASYGRPARRLLEMQSRNEERVFWRNIPTAMMLRALPHHAAVLLAKAWHRWQEGNLLPFLFGRLRLLGEVPSLVRHRRGLRRSSTAPQVESWGIELHYWRKTGDG
jgi:GT2 family glycosyltransferase